MSYIDEWSDKELASLSRKLKKIYKEAANDLSEVASDYFSKFGARFKKEYEAYQNGAYTDKQFREWYYAQVGRGKRWEALRDDMASRMTSVNQIASGYMNNMAARVTSENYNWSAYIIEDHAKRFGDDTYKSIAFNIMDENTIKRLSKGKQTMLPKSRVDIPKDERWNQTKMQNSLLQGILQGKSIDQISRHLAESVGNMNAVSAMRNARTMCTEAQNAGRQLNFEDAEKMGIPMEKEWIANTDDRVRASHAQLDGVRVKVGEMFPNGCEYPGDHRGDPSEVYNCRCTMRAVFLNYKTGKEQRESTGVKARGFHTKETYEAWKLGKAIEKATRDLSKSAADDIMEVQKFVFEPAKDIKEVKTRVSEKLGVPEDKISLGRMNIDLANQYLEGVEEFVNDFPEIKGLYTSIGTKVGGGSRSVVYGVNKLQGKGRYVGRDIVYDCTFELHYKNPKDVDELYGYYRYGEKSGQQYKNCGPKATAIHELVHGLDYAIGMKENGYFNDGKLQTVIGNAEWSRWTSSVSHQIRRETRQELWGIEHGSVVYEGVKYLGSYAMTNAKEDMAQAISYEYINESNPYGALMLKKLKERVRRAFG